MSDTPSWYLVIDIVATLTLVLTFLVIWRQLRAMQEQIEVTRQSTMAQNTFSVAQFLFDPDLSEGRRHMFEMLARKPFGNWTDEDKAKAQRVCSSYDIAGLLAMNGVVDRDVIVRHWGQTLKRLYPIMEPFINNRRDLSKDPHYWQSLEWLAEQVDADLRGIGDRN